MISAQTLPTSLQLVKRGVKALNERPVLWTLPLLSLAVRMITWGAGWYFALDVFFQNSSFGTKILLFLAILTPTFVVACLTRTFFDLALAHSLQSRLDEGRVLDQGLKKSWRRKIDIIQWTLIRQIASTGINTSGRFNGWLSSLGNISWALGMLFVMPLMAQGQRPTVAMEQSVFHVSQSLGVPATTMTGLWGIFQAIQMTVSLTGFVLLWVLVMSGWHIGAVAVGLLAGLLILVIRAYKEAITVAFATALLQNNPPVEATGSD